MKIGILKHPQSHHGDTVGGCIDPVVLGAIAYDYLTGIVVCKISWNNWEISSRRIENIANDLFAPYLGMSEEIAQQLIAEIVRDSYGEGKKKIAHLASFTSLFDRNVWAWIAVRNMLIRDNARGSIVPGETLADTLSRRYGYSMIESRVFVRKIYHAAGVSEEREKIAA